MFCYTWHRLLQRNENRLRAGRRGNLPIRIEFKETWGITTISTAILVCMVNWLVSKAAGFSIDAAAEQASWFAGVVFIFSNIVWILLDFDMMDQHAIHLRVDGLFWDIWSIMRGGNRHALLAVLWHWISFSLGTLETLWEIWMAQYVKSEFGIGEDREEDADWDEDEDGGQNDGGDRREDVLLGGLDWMDFGH
jgi:hypothetical protein